MNEIIESDEDFDARMTRMIQACGEGEATRWERQHRAYVTRDLALRESLVVAINRLADAITNVSPR